ncbi:MAG: hypothetical protein R3F07_01260 [Opitutaceae bacterium]
MKPESKEALTAGNSVQRPMQVDYFAILSVVMATLLVLSQGFLLIWLDLL